MNIRFILYERNIRINPKCRNTIWLLKDYWNDFGYVTLFHMTFVNISGEQLPIGSLKIGFKNQPISIPTHQKLTDHCQKVVFDQLPDGFFSLGQDVDYYINLQKLPDSDKKYILQNLKDIVYNPTLFSENSDQNVMKTSLLRDIREKSISDQFKRVLNGLPPLSDFNFSFKQSINF